MTLDLSAALSTRFTPVTVDIDRSRLRQFAQAIGEIDPIYWDVDAARRAGHPDLPVPPTYFFSLEFETREPFGYLTELGVDMGQVLHGEQAFTYHRLAYAGDTLRLQPEIIDAYSKRSGTLYFLVKRTEVTRADGGAVAEARAVTVVRANPHQAAS